MARRKPVEKQPVTSMPGMRKRKRSTGPYYAPPETVPPPFVPQPPTPDIDLDRVIQWVTLIGKPSDATELVSWWNNVNRRLKELGAKGNKSALPKLPPAEHLPNFNGAHLAGWIRKTKDIKSLQKLHAAIRLRIRHANWLNRRK
jgi:hypothetical protein